MAAIRYRGFYDVPRIFVVTAAGATYLFDCPFDDELDDYRDRYAVYRLSADVIPERGSWDGLPGRGVLLGEVPVAEVRFDPTRRQAMDAAVLDRVAPARPPLSSPP